jgi:hypothetical protein
MAWIECYQVFDEKDNVPCSTELVNNELCVICFGDEN